MLKQSSGRNHRGNRLRPKHSLQMFLLVAVSVWLMYQLMHSYLKRRAVAVETDSGGMHGELTRRRLGRKDFVDFAGHASEDDVFGIRGGGSNDESEDDVARDFASDRLSKGEEGEGGGSDEEDEESDEDDDGLAGDEEENDKDFQSENGDGEDELKTTRGKTERASAFGNADDGTHFHQPNELGGGRVVPQVNSTDGVQDGAAVPLVDGAAEYGIDMTPKLNSSRSLSNSDLSKNSSSDVLFNGREATDIVAKNLLFNDVALVVPGAEKPTSNASGDENHVLDRNWTADSVNTGSDKAQGRISQAESGNGEATRDNSTLPAD